MNKMMQCKSLFLETRGGIISQNANNKTWLITLFNVVL